MAQQRADNFAGKLQDHFGLIDGVAVTEPNAQPGDVRWLKIQQGSTLIPTIGKSLYDYFTCGNIY